MPKSKQTESDRPKRAPRDPSPERERELEREREESWRPSDETLAESDGTVDEEMEFDTDRYEGPRKSQNRS